MFSGRKIHVTDKEDIEENVRLENRKVNRTLANWFSGLFKCHSTSSASTEMLLIQYTDIIYRGYRDLIRSTWLQYNKEFRMIAAINLALS